MKFLTDRQEIAMAINFGKYPVLSIDRDNRPYESSDYAKGCRTRVAWDHSNPRYAGMTTHGNLYYENGKYAISSEGGMLTASFGYSDVMRMVTEANAVVVHKGQTVVVVENWSTQKMCRVRVMKVSDRIDTQCMTVATLEDID